MGETATGNSIDRFHFFWSGFHSLPFPLKLAIHFLSQLAVQGCIKHEEMVSFSC